MAILRVLSAGAAQAVVRHVMAEFMRDTGNIVEADFGAVGAMRASALASMPDVLLLTDAMIDELTLSGLLAPGRFDLGRVGTGVAVRVGATRPDVSNADGLRASLRAASSIACPDPAVATAGKIVMNCLEKLGVAVELSARLRFFPNGNAAMNWLAADAPAGALGITQNSEILPVAGVSYVAPLPQEFQAKATYSAARSATCATMQLARDFIERLTSANAGAMLQAAGFER
jgi:molybdate transport system substrate-binding protein